MKDLRFPTYSNKELITCVHSKMIRLYFSW